MAADGPTLLRYDNNPDHPGVSPHHRHTRETVESIEFTSINYHIDRFYEEMDERHEQREA